MDGSLMCLDIRPISLAIVYHITLGTAWGPEATSIGRTVIPDGPGSQPNHVPQYCQRKVQKFEKARGKRVRDCDTLTAHSGHPDTPLTDYSVVCTLSRRMRSSPSMPS